MLILVCSIIVVCVALMVLWSMLHASGYREAIAPKRADKDKLYEQMDSFDPMELRDRIEAAIKTSETEREFSRCLNYMEREFGLNLETNQDIERPNKP